MSELTNKVPSISYMWKDCAFCSLHNFVRWMAFVFVRSHIQIRGHLGCDAVYSYRLILRFQRNIAVSVFRTKLSRAKKNLFREVFMPLYMILNWAWSAIVFFSLWDQWFCPLCCSLSCSTFHILKCRAYGSSFHLGHIWHILWWKACMSVSLSSIFNFFAGLVCGSSCFYHLWFYVYLYFGVCLLK